MSTDAPNILICPFALFRMIPVMFDKDLVSVILPSGKYPFGNRKYKVPLALNLTFSKCNIAIFPLTYKLIEPLDIAESVIGIVLCDKLLFITKFTN